MKLAHYFCSNCAHRQNDRQTHDFALAEVTKNKTTITENYCITGVLFHVTVLMQKNAKLNLTRLKPGSGAFYATHRVCFTAAETGTECRQVRRQLWYVSVTSLTTTTIVYLAWRWADTPANFCESSASRCHVPQPMTSSLSTALTLKQRNPLCHWGW